MQGMQYVITCNTRLSYTDQWHAFIPVSEDALTKKDRGIIATAYSQKLCNKAECVPSIMNIHVGQNREIL